MDEIEAEIERLSDALETETNRYKELADLDAEAEADYKLASAAGFIRYADSAVKMTNPEKDARVLNDNAPLYRQHLLLAARLRATKEALTSYGKRLDAYRTLAANARALT